MLLRFIGDYTGKRTSITLFGVTFNGREPADMTDEEGIRRLSNHPEFEAVDEPMMVLEPLPSGDIYMTADKPKPRGRPRKL